MTRTLFFVISFFLSSSMVAQSYVTYCTWETGFFRQGFFSNDNNICNSADSVIDGTDPLFGTKSARFQLTWAEANCNSTKRADLKFPTTPYRFFDLWIKLDTSYLRSDPIPEVLFQMHQVTDLYGTNKIPMGHQVSDGNHRVILQFYPNGLDTNAVNDGLITITQSLGSAAIDAGVKRHWTYEFVPSTGSDGIWRIWKDGVKVFERLGPNYNPGQGTPYAKVGPYKWQWASGPPTANIAKRVWWMDEVKVGTNSNSIADFILQPSTLSFVSKTESSIAIAIDTGNNPLITGYKIFRNNSLIATIGKVPAYNDAGLTAGTSYSYQVQAIDARDDTSGKSNTLIATTAYELLYNFTTTNATCNGGSSGKVKINILSGNAPYNILWSNGATADSIVNVPAGGYSFDISDASGQAGTGSVTVGQPTVVSATAVQVGPVVGGYAPVQVSASGGFAPYDGTGTFNAPVGTTVFPVTDFIGCPSVTSVTVVGASNGGSFRTVRSFKGN